MLPFFFSYCSRPPRALHSFPTRRSSDLAAFRTRLVRDELREFLAHGERISLAIAALQVRYHAFERMLLHRRDRKSTRLNSSHVEISYAVFCLKKKKKKRGTGRRKRRRAT